MSERDDWCEWKAAYIRRFLGPDENADFVETWKEEILKRDLADMLHAIGKVATDGSYETTKPRFHLRLLLEYADALADLRKPGWVDPFKGQKPPERSTAWNQRMFELGIITKKELAKREREKERAS
jgi:hypothetical protein